MFKLNTAKVVLAGALTVVLAGAGVSAASAAITPAGSTSAYYIFDATTEALVADGAPIAFDQLVAGYPSDTGFSDYDQMFTGPAATTQVYVFVSPRGDERDTSKWLGRQMNGFNDFAAKTVLTPAMLLNNLAGANYASVKANGGNFSAGLAFTSSNGVTVEDVSFVHITVQPGGSWSYTATKDSGTTTPTDPEGDSADIDLEAGVIEADGSLELTVPANAKATFTTPTLTTQGLSQSTATLPQVTVADTRKTVDRDGWDLTQSVTDFVSGTNTIDKKNLGVAPKVVTTTQGATAAPAQVAGSATYPSPFASAAAGSAGTSTTLGADLTLVAPAGTPEGTYTSKMTLTLVSK
ncbi:hypothetical protein ACFXQA_01985 [Microbacterium sp. P07]|uniref:hypothetical protein n=1 Tax=Microbacterium sp. P07 TaxID=3366952 RepID=UPI003746DD9B